MPDSRSGRGPDPRDHAQLGPAHHARLATATRQLSWLLAEGFRSEPARRLVGDHHQLTRRQRVAIGRAACAPATAARRRAQTGPVAGARVAVDGFNQLVHLEAALAGAALLHCVDGRSRDLASVHGTWRSVAGTEAALDQLVAALAPAAAVCWVLDRPVSNSGRLAALLRARGQEVVLENAADRALAALGAAGWSLATADGPLLDRVGASVELAGPLARACRPADDPLVVDLRLPTPEGPAGPAPAPPATGAPHAPPPQRPPPTPLSH